MFDTTQKFNDRADDYAKYRPRYPQGVFDLLTEECEVGQECAVADVGSGTGIFAMGLVETGARVFGVEPNGDMRREMERSAPQVVGLPTTAENTWLTSRSIDLVTCAQSFHWFDFGAARREFLRILRPDGWVALVWNERLDDATPFMVGYQKALEAYCPDYANARHRERSEDDLRAFFLPFEMRVASFPNEQRLDFEGLVGRSLSSSYAPLEGEPEHAAFIGALKSLFGEFSVEGVVSFPYSTRVYYGRLVSDETE